MLIVQKYSKERHLDLLKDWTKSWGMAEYPWDYLPDTGFVVYDDDPVLLRLRPLACMMLRQCEKQTALIDYLISAPEKNVRQRDLIREGIGKMFAEGEWWAEQHDIKLVMAITQYPHVKALAENFGFQVSDATKLWRVTK